MLQTIDVNVNGREETLLLSLGHIVKETEDKVYIVFQDGVKVFCKDEYGKAISA